MKKTMLGICVLGLALAWSTAAEAREIRFGHVGPTFHGQHQGSLAFAKYVKEKTGGELNIQVFPLGQLGGEMSMAEQVQGGALEMASITTAVLENFVPQAAVLDFPFVFPSRKTAYDVLADKEFQEKLFSFFPAKGFEAIGYTENEFRDITNSKRPIHQPGDLAGLKIRVMKSPVYLDAFNQLGASAVPMDFPEIYNALQQGVIDGQENPLYTSILMKFTEVNKFATRTQHILTECIILVNLDFWNSLPPEQQKIMRAAADVCIAVNREVSQGHFLKLPKLDISIDDYCRQNKVEVVDLTEQERQAFAAAMKPVWAKYRDFVGPEFH
ncbi:MAG: DctP family TRAP transporter solute-binding subunit, partial [Pseudomonadota bacterium]